MNTIPTIRNRHLLTTALIVWGLGSVLNAAEPTAFELIKEGNRHVGEEAKDRVVQIRSEKSVATLTPNIWYVVYYDPDATAKATEVKFGAGKKLAVKRPPRFLEPFTGQQKQLNREKMKIDSDKAIEIAKKEPLLDKLTLTATQLWLERLAWHSDDTPIWRIRLWAAKLRHPKDSADIGELYISAEDGKVIKNDLHIDRVD
ncbi:MAG: hypothetical protein HY298_11290 [Verrucomicrobia bacterium]|nr:hypothetical protein [Verrucomicrobiota bacterium]